MSDHPLTTNPSNFDVYFSAKVDETIVVSKFIRYTEYIAEFPN